MGVGCDGAGSTKVMEKDPEGSGQNTSVRHLTLSSMRGVRIASGGLQTQIRLILEK